MDSQIDKVPNTEIAATAQEINKLHSQAEALAKTSKEYASQAIQLALEIGAMLIKERANCEKGKWIEWQEKNLSFKRTRAHQYISLFERVCGLPYDTMQHTAGKIKQDNTECSPVVNIENTAREGICDISTRKLLNDAKSLRQAMTIVGIIPQSPKRNKCDSISPTITFTKYIDGFILWYKKRISNEPISDWQPETRAMLITNLRPIVAIYKELIQLQDEVQYPVRNSQRILS